MRPPNQDVTSIQLAFDRPHESCASAPQHKQYVGVFMPFFEHSQGNIRLEKSYYIGIILLFVC